MSSRAALVPSPVTDLRSRVTHFRSRVTDFRSRVTDLRSSVTHFRSRVTHFPSRVTDFPSRVTLLRSRVAFIEENLTLHRTNVRDMRPSVTGSRGRVTEVRCGITPITRNEMMGLIKPPPMSPAERQRACRARKRGEAIGPVWGTAAPGLPSPESKAKPAASLPAPADETPALPPPSLSQTTAIQPTAAALGLPRAIADASEDAPGEALRLSLPPAVAARLKALLDRHHAGTKPLTAAERAEAEGLLDIAEYFAVQRLRQRLAA
jgi:hypothetical protein